MAVTQNPADLDGPDASLGRLEAALDVIARGIQAQAQVHGPADMPADPEVLDEVEQRLDAVIDQVKAVLGRKSDQ